MGFDGGNGDEEDAGDRNEDPLEADGDALPEADVFIEGEDLVREECGDHDTERSEVEDVGGQRRDVVGEDGVAELGVEEVWQVAGETQEKGCCGPEEMILEQCENGMPSFKPGDFFVFHEVEDDERKVGDAPGPAAELFVLIFEGGDVGWGLHGVHINWRVDLHEFVVAFVFDE